LEWKPFPENNTASRTGASLAGLLRRGSPPHRFAGATDGVEAFEREAKRIDALMAASALRIAAVALDQLKLDEALRSFLGEHRHALWRTRQLFAEDHFAEPVAAQDRAGACGSGLLRQRGGEAEHPAAALRAQAIHALPVLAFHLQPIMLASAPFTKL